MTGSVTTHIGISTLQRQGRWPSKRFERDVGPLQHRRHVSERPPTRADHADPWSITGLGYIGCGILEIGMVEQRRHACDRRPRRLYARGRGEEPWEVLGVSPVADQKEIKKAHRKLVLEHHPDRHTVDDDLHKRTIQKRFMKIQEAYEMLMGRRHGNILGPKAEQNGWNFHDFFWSFNYHRRKREEQMGSCGMPPPPAGSWKGQMENLKRRAAMRRWRKGRETASNTPLESTGARGNIMHGGSGVKVDHSDQHEDGFSEGTGARESDVEHRAVSSQLLGLKRRAALKKTILEKTE